MVRKMKKNVNEKRYPNINEAVAFKIAFIPMLYGICSYVFKEVMKCSQGGGHVVVPCLVLAEQMEYIIIKKV